MLMKIRVLCRIL